MSVWKQMTVIISADVYYCDWVIMYTMEMNPIKKVESVFPDFPVVFFM